MKKYLFFLIALLIICIIVILFIFHQNDISGMFSTIFKNSLSTVVIIDAGHGGFDCGAIGVGNIYEKDINLAVSIKLRDLLNLNGYIVKMTRVTDVGTESPDAVSIRQKKHSDIKNRLKLMNENKNGIYISIHQNMFSQSKYYGSQVFYSGNNEGSRILAENIQSQLIDLLQPQNNRRIKRATSDIFLLYNANKEMPSIMVECGFMSNENELKLLMDLDYQKKLAFSIFSGLTKFLYTEI